MMIYNCLLKYIFILHNIQQLCYFVCPTSPSINHNSNKAFREQNALAHRSDNKQPITEPMLLKYVNVQGDIKPIQINF